jgi:hypothetical protein
MVKAREQEKGKEGGNIGSELDQNTKDHNYDA